MDFSSNVLSLFDFYDMLLFLVKRKEDFDYFRDQIEILWMLLLLFFFLVIYSIGIMV